MARLNKIEILVKKILRNHPETRGSDDLLLAEVYKELGVDGYAFDFVMKNRKFLKLPAFESVSRCRRKIQEVDISLVDPNTQQTRYEAQKVYEDYSKYGGHEE